MSISVFNTDLVSLEMLKKDRMNKLYKNVIILELD